MEHILVSQSMKHLEDHIMLSDSQFQTQYYCESLLFITINDIAWSLIPKTKLMLRMTPAVLDGGS